MRSLMFRVLWAVVLPALFAGAAERIVPPHWDPVLAGDRVMDRLVKFTGPGVKGAHDAAFAMVDRHAYIVAEVDDERTGESAAPAIMQPGVKLFTDRDYTLTEAPRSLVGREFLRTSIEGYTIECVAPGELHVMTLSKDHYANRRRDLLARGFQKSDTPEFQLFPGAINRVFAYHKRL